MKRLALVVFYEQNGILLDYVKFYLDSLLKSSFELVLIANGEINQSALDWLNDRGVVVLQRENYGIDFAAWQHGFHWLGWEKVEKYDEVLLTNCTCYGPVYPLENMLAEMERNDADFWGISRHPAQLDIRLIPTNPDSYVREHLQSYFLIFKKKVITSKAFQNFFDKLVPAKSYNEEVAEHETKLTEYLENNGFHSDCFLPFSKYSRSGVNAPVFDAVAQLTEDKCPFIKRRVFTSDYLYWVDTGIGSQAGRILSFLKQHTKYPLSYIYQDLLKHQPMSLIHDSLHLNFVCSKTESKISALQDGTLAAVFFCYYSDLVDYNLKYLRNFPENTYIAIISSSDELLKQYQAKLNDLGYKNVEVRLIPPKGRDVSAYLVGAKDIFSKFKYVCCLHDKKTSQAGYLIGSEFCRHCFENNVASRPFIFNVIDIFEENPYIGMLVPPSSHLALSWEMGKNRNHLCDLYKKYKLSIPFDEQPLAPFGTMFWVRGEAFSVIKRVPLTFEDFPKEPIPPDGTVLHAYERLYPALVQEAGYFTGSLFTPEYISVLYDYNTYKLRELLKRIHRTLGNPPFYKLLEVIENNSNISQAIGVRRAFFYFLKESKLRFFPNCEVPKWLKTWIKNTLIR